MKHRIGLTTSRTSPVALRALIPAALLCSYCSSPSEAPGPGGVVTTSPSDTTTGPSTPAPVTPTGGTPTTVTPNPVTPITPVTPTTPVTPGTTTAPTTSNGTSSSSDETGGGTPSEPAPTSDGTGTTSEDPVTTEGTGDTGAQETTDTSEPIGPIEQPADPCAPRAGYRNLLKEFLNKTDEEVTAKVNTAFEHLFYGGQDEKIYYEVNGDEAYILDVNNNDIRSEGMSYGMTIAVQLDKKAEFDKIWKWARNRMYVSSGQLAGYFNWQMSTQGTVIGGPSAPDGEEYFAHALLLASRRWGDGQGIFNYGTEARNLLDALVTKGAFDQGNHLVKFGPTCCNYSDPSYVLPAFYEVWACFDTKNQQFWKQAVTAGRTHLQRATDRPNGLAPYLSNFDGSPHQNGAYFDTDAWRVVGNIMMDYNLYNRDEWKVDFANRFADFFDMQRDKELIPAQFELNGDVRIKDGMREEYNELAKGLWSQNAFVAYAVEPEQGRTYVQTLWDLPLPTGQYRYYDGVLYMLSLLHLSGNFRSEW